MVEIIKEPPQTVYEKRIDSEPQSQRPLLQRTLQSHPCQSRMMAHSDLGDRTPLQKIVTDEDSASTNSDPYLESIKSKTRPKLQQRLTEIMNLLIENSGDKTLIQAHREKPFTINLIESPINNAGIKLESNQIFYFHGRFRRQLEQEPIFHNWDPVAFTLAHELSHYIYLKNNPQVPSYLKERMDLKHYMEYFCDRKAIELMDRAGFNIHFGDSLFENHKHMTAKSALSDLDITSSHPPDEKRKLTIDALTSERYYRNYSTQSKYPFSSEEIAEIQAPFFYEREFTDYNSLENVLIACEKKLNSSEIDSKSADYKLYKTVTNILDESTIKPHYKDLLRASFSDLLVSARSQKIYPQQIKIGLDQIEDFLEAIPSRYKVFYNSNVDLVYPRLGKLIFELIRAKAYRTEDFAQVIKVFDLVRYKLGSVESKNKFNIDLKIVDEYFKTKPKLTQDSFKNFIQYMYPEHIAILINQNQYFKSLYERYALIELLSHRYSNEEKIEARSKILGSLDFKDFTILPKLFIANKSSKSCSSNQNTL